MQRGVAGRLGARLWGRLDRVVRATRPLKRNVSDASRSSGSTAEAACGSLPADAPAGDLARVDAEPVAAVTAGPGRELEGVELLDLRCVGDVLD
jgi:hypothetical protein